jgi:hypothetical protein
MTGKRRKKTLTIRVRWDGGTTLVDGTRGVWFAHDDVWAYGTGKTPEAAVKALFETIRDVLPDARKEPTWEQGQPYLEWFAQPKAGDTEA